jgi:tetratricopeptide (TPR) repeat protein
LSRERRGLLLLALATALLYLPTLSAEFVGFDEDDYVTANPRCAATGRVAHLRSPPVAVPTTSARLAVWRNTDALWNLSLRDTPNVAFFWNGLGAYYLKKGDTESAEPALRRALELAPDLELARFNRALILANHDKPADGIAELQRAARFSPRVGPRAARCWANGARMTKR